MKTQFREISFYVCPMIERIELDNEIALVLESSPPTGPDEGYLKVPEYLDNYPFT